MAKPKAESDDRRSSNRMPFPAKVKVVHDSLGERLLNTRDLSDVGIFVLTEHAGSYALGDKVTVQVQGMAEAAPILTMEVVRTDSTGMGLKFIFDDEDDG